MESKILFEASCDMLNHIQNFDIDKQDSIEEKFFSEECGGLDLNILKKVIYHKYSDIEFKNIKKIITFNLIDYENNDYLFKNKKSITNNLLLTIINIFKYQTSLDYRCFIETLLNDDNEIVIGFRLWFFIFYDFENNFQEKMKQLFTDCKWKIRALDNFEKKKTKSPEDIEELKLNKEIYQYIYAQSHYFIFDNIKKYLFREVLLLNGSIHNMNNNNNNNINSFTDDHLTNLLNQLDENKYLDLLSKENSMIYHTKNVNKNQTLLHNYFYCENITLNDNNQNIEVQDILTILDNIDDNHDDLINKYSNNNNINNNNNGNNNQNRLNLLRSLKIEDSLFKSFPYPNLVYEIPKKYLFPEFFYYFPLPHTISTNLSYKFIFNNTEKKFKSSLSHLVLPKFTMTNNLQLIGLYDMIYISDIYLYIELYHELDENLKDDENNIKITEFIEQTKSFSINNQFKNNRTLYSYYKKIGSKFIEIRKENLKNLLEFYIHQIIPTKLNIVRPFSKIYNGNNNQSKSQSKISLFNSIINETYKKIKKEKRNKSDQEKTAEEFYNYCSEKPPMTINNNQHQWFKEILNKYTPTKLKVGNISELMKYQKNSNLPQDFLEKDVFLQLNIINTERYLTLKKVYPNYDDINNDDYFNYNEEYRIVQDAMMAELFYYFFNCGEKLLSKAFLGIRTWMQENQHKFYIRNSGSSLNITPYGQYRTWINSFFHETANLVNHYPLATLIYMARFHALRYYQIKNIKENSKTKLNILMSGDGASSKTFMLKLAQWVTPKTYQTCINATQTTKNAFNVNENLDGLIRIHDEISKSFLSSNNNDGNDEMNSQLKNILTSHQTETRSCGLVKEKIQDDVLNTVFINNKPVFKEKTNRIQEIFRCSCQNVLLAATNEYLGDKDPNLLSRTVVAPVPRSKTIQSDDVTISDFTNDPNKIDVECNNVITFEHQVLYSIYAMLECAIKANALEEDLYGIGMSGGLKSSNAILDILFQQNGIDTSSTRKRDHQTELSRILTISYAIWLGMTSPFTEYLFDFNGQRIGFNHRILTLGILPFCVVTKEQVIDSILLLSFTFLSNYLDEILKIFAKQICKFESLKITLENQKIFYYDIENKEYDYNYICKDVQSLNDLAQEIHSLIPDMSISKTDIKALLTKLSETSQDQYSYILKVNKEINPDNILELEKDPKNNKLIKRPRPIAKHEQIMKSKNKIRFCISINYILEKFPNFFNDETEKDINININKNKDINVNDILSIMDNPNKNHENIINKYTHINNLIENQTNKKIKECINLTEESNPFIKAIKTFYENSCLEKCHLSEETHKDLIKNYKTDDGIIPYRRLLAPIKPKDFKLFEFNPDTLPIGRTNIVKFNPVMSVITLTPNNKKGYTFESKTSSLISTKELFKKNSFIKTSTGDYELHAIDQEKMYKNEKLIEKQRFDHDYESCMQHLKNIRHPGFYSLPKEKYINFPLVLYHYFSEEYKLENPSEPRKLYPECDIRHLINTRKTFLKKILKEQSKIEITEKQLTNQYPHNFNLDFGQKDRLLRKPIPEHSIIQLRKQNKKNREFTQRLCIQEKDLKDNKRKRKNENDDKISKKQKTDNNISTKSSSKKNLKD
jgi:hypothetical protein